MFLSSQCHFEFSTLDSAFPLFMFQSSQIDSPSARHLRRSQHEKWKVLIRVENTQWQLAGQKNTIANNLSYISSHSRVVCTRAITFFFQKFGVLQCWLGQVSRGHKNFFTHFYKKIKNKLWKPRQTFGRLVLAV